MSSAALSSLVRHGMGAANNQLRWLNANGMGVDGSLWVEELSEDELRAITLVEDDFARWVDDHLKQVRLGSCRSADRSSLVGTVAPAPVCVSLTAPSLVPDGN